MNRKEKIKAYKQSIQPMGIYQIKNKANGKIFLGSSKNLKGILNRVRFQLKNNSYTNKDLQKDFNVFGETNFSFDILDYLEPKEDTQGDYTKELKTLESMWLEKIQPFDELGYNHKTGN